VITITELNVYPVKSCRGIALTDALLTPTGIAHDRQWMVVTPDGRFVTQREQPRLALISTALTDVSLRLEAVGMPTLELAFDAANAATMVSVWSDRCSAFDQGEAAHRWLSEFLHGDYRLVRFDPTHKRASSAEWTHEIEALNQFSDGYPLLVLSRASVDDLSRRVGRVLPMNRFRPNVVLDGLPAYGEDSVHEFTSDSVQLRVVKPCTRCKITTTDQDTAQVDGEEPLRTLKSYRFSRELRGVLFGQNVVIAAGIGSRLSVGMQLQASARAG
jgi:uncharacterized protein YcbX